MAAGYICGRSFCLSPRPAVFGDSVNHNRLPATTSVNTDVTTRRLPWRNARRHAANTGRRGGVSPRRPEDQAADRSRARAAPRVVRQLCGRAAALRNRDEQWRRGHSGWTARGLTGPPAGARRCRGKARHGCGRCRGGAAVGAGRNAGDSDCPLSTDARRLSAARTRTADLRHAGAHRCGGPRRGCCRRQPGVTVCADAAGPERQLAVLVRRLRHRLLQRADPGVAAVAHHRSGRAGVIGHRIRAPGIRPGRQRRDHR
jgi:hypothetical protein